MLLKSGDSDEEEEIVDKECVMDGLEVLARFM